MVRSLTFVLTCYPIATLFATQITAIDTQGWCGTFETNGWHVQARGKLSDGHLWFNAGEDQLLSPHFSGDVAWIEVEAKCSNETPPRRMFLTGYRGTEIAYGPTNVTPVTKRMGYERFVLERAKHVDGFGLEVEKGRSGSWTIYGMRVGVTENRVVTSRVERVSSYGFELGWTNGCEVASNEVQIAQLQALPPAMDYFTHYDFSFLTNETGSTKSVLKDIQALWSAFDGSNVCLGAKAGGYAMIGTSVHRGVLSFQTAGTCRDLTLVVRARKHPTDDSGWIMPLTASSGASTFPLADLTLSDTLQDFFVSLADLPEDATIYFHSVTNRITASRDNARTDLYAMGLAYSIFPGAVVTNVLQTHVVRGEAFRVNACAALSEYFWRVRGLAEDGWPQPWPAWQPVTTRPPAGTGIYMR